MLHCHSERSGVKNLSYHAIGCLQIIRSAKHALRFCRRGHETQNDSITFTD